MITEALLMENPSTSLTMDTPQMTEALLTSLSVENPSTSLTIDTPQHDSQDWYRHGVSQGGGSSRPPPDINLPLRVDVSQAADGWLGSLPLPTSSLDVSLGQPLQPPAKSIHHQAAAKSKRSLRREDAVWGAWYFFSHYFRPSLQARAQGKLGRDGLPLCAIEAADLCLDAFLVQHDMENSYMWALSKRPECALGKMQLRSWMNGQCRAGEPSFPFSVVKGHTRSHRMQRKHYRGLSNPQCIHGIEALSAPNLAGVSAADRKRWSDLTGWLVLAVSVPQIGRHPRHHGERKNAVILVHEDKGLRFVCCTSAFLVEPKQHLDVRGARPVSPEREFDFEILREADDLGAWATTSEKEEDGELDNLQPPKSSASSGHKNSSTEGLLRKARSPPPKSSGACIFGHDPTLSLSRDLSTNARSPIGEGEASTLVVHKRRRKPPDGAPGFIGTLGLAMPFDLQQLSDETPGRSRLWACEFSGVMRGTVGPVTGAKTLYEDEQGYLVVVSLALTDIRRLRVSWRNHETQAIVKVHCQSIGRVPFLAREGRTFWLSDVDPEHCPSGDFIREIKLPSRIPENAELKATYSQDSAALEILIPKTLGFSEEKEVQIQFGCT
eukprot:SM000062S19913  [mRNA]  locus=s62:381441:385538:+ [translate_table: standard]